MPRSGANVCHGVNHAGHKADGGQVAVVPLVEGLQPEETGDGAGGGRRPLVAPTDCGGVVGESVGSTFPNVGSLGEDLTVGDGGGEFEVAVGNGAPGVGV